MDRHWIVRLVDPSTRSNGVGSQRGSGHSPTIRDHSTVTATASMPVQAVDLTGIHSFVEVAGRFETIRTSVKQRMAKSRCGAGLAGAKHQPAAVRLVPAQHRPPAAVNDEVSTRSRRASPWHRPSSGVQSRLPVPWRPGTQAGGVDELFPRRNRKLSDRWALPGFLQDSTFRTNSMRPARSRSRREFGRIAAATLPGADHDRRGSVLPERV